MTFFPQNNGSNGINGGFGEDSENMNNKGKLLFSANCLEIV